MTRRRPTLAAVAVAFLATATALSACSSPDTDPEASADPRAIVLAAAEELRELGAEENAEALADGQIEYDEYLEAGRRYQACLREVGVVIEGPHLSPVDNLWLLWKLPESVAGGDDVAQAVSACDQHWHPVAAAYLDSHTPKMDEALRSAVSECLKDQGHDLTGDEKVVADFMGKVEANPTTRMADAEQCIIESSQRLYPDLPGVTIIY